ncbi:peptidase S9 family protein [Halobacterium hubeiense]|uniref:Peptidase S9 family protein n=1 Tax=Halobacterium hubeiense TaxID=1407499 RepID=A0A0U5GZS3_9EURY|nr:S9 family peptidase [Halobacterium hubeiense]CQH49931.1 peptidase S9 family protein [Halobacterium hubeiense]
MAYDIERYLNVRSAGGPTFGPAGELAFTLDVTGSNQVWRVDAPEAWPDQLTFHDERVAHASFSPTRDELVYAKDAGGDEFWQLHRLAADGSEDVALTDDPDAKHHFGGWSHDGDRIAYAANRREQGVFDVYVQGREETGADAELLVEGDDYDMLAAAGWSPSDDRLLLHESHSNFDADLHVVDVASGEVTHATPFEEDVQFSSVAWTADGDGVYVCTNRGADTHYLGLLDPETGDIEEVERGGDWPLESVAVHHDSGRLAYVRNVDGYSELTLADSDGATLDEHPDPDLLDGVVFGLSFDSDGERVAVSASSPTENGNVYVVDVETGDSRRWTDAATAGIPKETFREPELIHYESFDGLEIPAFLTLPDGDGPHPVVVDFHGGPEAQRRPWFTALRQYFADNGYAVFEPNVRGSSGYGTEYMNLDNVRNRMDSVKDGKAGVEWLAARDDVDEDRVVAYGGSYGGFMVLASLTEYPDLWAAGVDVVGIANFVTFLENTGDWRREHREAEYGSLADDREFLEAISPVNNADRIRAPLLVLHGANDPRVPVEEAEQIVEQAGEHVPTEKLVFEDEGHGFTKLENKLTAYRAVVDFLDEHV